MRIDLPLNPSSFLSSFLFLLSSFRRARREGRRRGRGGWKGKIYLI